MTRPPAKQRKNHQNSDFDQPTGAPKWCNNRKSNDRFRLAKTQYSRFYFWHAQEKEGTSRFIQKRRKTRTATRSSRTGNRAIQNLFQNIRDNRNTPAESHREQLEGLANLSISDLKKQWLDLYKSEPPKRLSRELLTRAIAHKMQKKALGGLKAATKRRLAAMVTEYEQSGKISLPSRPRVKPGTRLVRQWHGKTHSVTVLDKGFEYDGEHYRSLSAIARAITGARWSGPRFFGISS